MINKIKLSIRWKIAIISIITLCSAFCISVIFIHSTFFMLRDGEWTVMELGLFMLSTCFMTMLLGGSALWYVSKFITDPIVKVSKAVKKIAEGDFSVRLEPVGQDEIGQLAVGVNKMIKELNGMEYMGKDFMSNVSHEIKTPVSAITGFSELLLDGNLSVAKEKEYLSCLYSESLRLSRLCDNMLKMSKLDNQEIITDRKEFYVDEQIRKCMIFLSEKFEEKEIDFELNLKKCKIKNNSDLLYQVWINLIENAIKFSKEKGKIYVSATCNEDNTEIQVIIKDEGPGIRADKLPKIFDKFYQCDESHKTEGHGLGLSIVKRIIQLTGGSIECTSQENEGCEFRIILRNI
jgi:signal transduction histidine kinase